MQNQLRDISNNTVASIRAFAERIIGGIKAPKAGLRLGLALFVLLVCGGVAQAAASYTLQGQSFGSSVWDKHGIAGWGELECIPTRIDITGGPVSNATITVSFPHDNGGAPPSPGIQE